MNQKIDLVAQIHREACGLYALQCPRIQSREPICGETFVTCKITRNIAHIFVGLQDGLYLGNLPALVDWGHARNYVQMQWLVLQQEKLNDLVIASRVPHSFRQLVELGAQEVRVMITFEEPVRQSERMPTLPLARIRRGRVMFNRSIG